jgi:hypothetical protein
MYMVHLRAKNLPEKGKVEKWLFETDVIKSGDDFALVRTVSNQEIVIKSHIDGVVVKTLKLGSIVKNEISRYVKRRSPSRWESF